MRIALHNFTGGEVSPILAARYDLSRYGSSVQCMENMLPGLHGDVPPPRDPCSWAASKTRPCSCLSASMLWRNRTSCSSFRGMA